MPIETIGTTVNPAGSMPNKGIETVERPPASPEVSTIQPVTSVIQTVADPTEQRSQDIQEEVAKALETVEIMMELRDRSVQFVVDKESGADVIKVVDDNTGEVIRQIPTDELLNFMRNLTKMLGSFLDERV